MSALTQSLQHHRRDDSKSDASIASSTTPSTVPSAAASSSSQQQSSSASTGTGSTTAGSGSSSIYHGLKVERLSPTEIQERADMIADSLIQPNEQQQSYIQQIRTPNTNISVIGFLISNIDGEILRSYGTLDIQNNQQISSLVRNILLNVQSFITGNMIYRAEKDGSTGGSVQSQQSEALEKITITFKRETYVITHTTNLIIILQQSDGKG